MVKRYLIWKRYPILKKAYVLESQPLKFPSESFITIYLEFPSTS